MAGGWAMHLWNKWSIQILILLSFKLQIVIFLFARRRQCNSRVWRLLLWLAYLLADTTALYTLGHISNSKLPELRPPAFWAQFLLLHLGGQDTMTAYALEDNQLWLRHLLTLVLQAVGAAYMFYRHIADGGTLIVLAAVLIYLVGFMKYGERVWTLKSSSHEGITNFLDNVKLDQTPQGQNPQGQTPRDLFQYEEDPAENRVIPLRRPVYILVDDEHVLRDAHDLLYICMGQFVDYKVWPSAYQGKVISSYYRRRYNGWDPFKLAGMQLSLMHDIFYTKAVVIHTWYGCCNRAVSLVAMVTALVLFRFKAGKDGYTRVDVTFTYILLGGAIVMEITSILRAIGSSWTRAIFLEKIKSLGRDSSRWDFPGLRGILHMLLDAVFFFRRLFKSAGRGRNWSGSVGQHNLLDLFTMKKDISISIARIAGLEKWLNKLSITGTVDISDENKKLMLNEILRIVKACEGSEDIMRSYRGQNSIYSSLPHGQFQDTIWCVHIDFDESIIVWHFATNIFLLSAMDNTNEESSSSQELKAAIKVLSNYLMFLLVEHPYMLPSPVRARQYDLAYRCILAVTRDTSFAPTSQGFHLAKEILEHVQKEQSGTPAVLVRGATLATMLLTKLSDNNLERMILGVWVEMLCYAASHCSRDSHAKQLNSGAELITVVWIVQTMMFNGFNAHTDWFRVATSDFFQSRNRQAAVDAADPTVPAGSP